MWLSLAIVAFTITAAVDYRWFRTFVWPIYLVNIAPAGATLAVGTGVGGVSRWVTIGPLQFQFSEVAKILMADRARQLGRVTPTEGGPALHARGRRGAWPAPALVLVLIQPDLGTSLVFGAIGFGALFVSGASLRWIGPSIVALVAGLLPIIWTEVLKDYQKQRLMAFLDPEADPLGSGFQLLQSQIAVSTGGLFGKGLTGRHDGRRLPAGPSTDFVFARLGEELGFVGGLVMLVLFALLLWRVMRIGWRSRDLFGLAFAGGIGAMLLFQLLVNVGMVLGIMPITGIPLPFVTHGGASLVSIAHRPGHPGEHRHERHGRPPGRAGPATGRRRGGQRDGRPSSCSSSTR